LNEIILDRFKRANDKIAPDLIGQDELAVLTDAVLDYKIGKPVKRGNFTRYDAEVSAGADILKLADVKSSYIGSELMPNAVDRNFSGASAWTNVDLNSYDETGDLSLGALNAGEYCVLPEASAPQTAGHKYILYFDVANIANSWTITNYDGTNFIGIVDTNGLQQSLTFIATAVGGLRITANTDTIVVDFDNFSLKEIISEQQHILASVADEVRAYNPATNSWEDWITGLTSGQKFKMIPFANNHIFIFDTDDDPRERDLDTRELFNLELSTPSDADILAIQSFHDDGGNLTHNTLYKWLIVGITEDGQLGPPSRPFTHIFADETVALPGDPVPSRTTDDGTLSDKIYFKNLPYIADTRIVSRMIFRNKADFDLSTITTGEVYYLAAILDNDPSGASYEDEWEDNISDTDLGTEIAIYLNTPTRAKHIAFSNERLFLGNFSVVDRNFISPVAITDNGGTPPTGYSVGVEITFNDYTTGGSLLNSTPYDYRIHYEDKYGRRSKYYHQCGTTTSGVGTNDHRLQISNIGGLDIETAREYPIMSVYRRTGGTGDYYLISKKDLTYPLRSTYFVDTGIANGTEIWTDPELNIKSYPSAICFSEISSPSTIRDEDKRQIFQDDNDDITGLFDDRDGLIIFKKSSINKLFLSGNPNNWRLIRLTEDYGCDQPDTIQKSGSSFYFIYRNKAYRYDIGADKPVDIGYFFQDTLNTMQSWYDSTINDRWYCIQAKTATVSYTLVYDMKLDTWYKFKRTQSASEDFKTIYFTKYGSSEQLLSNADTYVSIYNELGDSPTATRADTEIGSTRQISPVVTSKTFKFPEGISLARLRKLKFDYSKVTSQDTSIIITDADTATTIVLTDNTGSGKKLYESGIGKDTDTLKITRAFNVSIQGAGMEVFDNLRIEYRPIKRGKLVGN